MTDTQRSQDSCVMLGADDNLYPDPEGYTPSLAMLLIPYTNARKMVDKPVPGR